MTSEAILCYALAAFTVLGLLGFIKGIVDKWDSQVVAWRWKRVTHGFILLMVGAGIAIAQCFGWVVVCCLIAQPLRVSIESWQFKGLLAITFIPVLLSLVHLMAIYDRFGDWLYDKMGLKEANT